MASCNSCVSRSTYLTRILLRRIPQSKNFFLAECSIIIKVEFGISSNQLLIRSLSNRIDLFHTLQSESDIIGHLRKLIVHINISIGTVKQRNFWREKIHQSPPAMCSHICKKVHITFSLVQSKHFYQPLLEITHQLPWQHPRL